MYELDRQRFGAFVAQLRKEKGYTQKELAQRLMISDKAVSKWETAVTIPDTSLLIPLSETLGVTVTELLMGERMAQQKQIVPEAAERIVKTAIMYTDSNPIRAYQERSKRGILFSLAVVAELTCLFVLYRLQMLTNSVMTAVMLATIFGAYFFFAVRLQLPNYYDENKISAMYDGPIRMNVPGLHFNNTNWPHIVRVGRIWCLANMVLYPVLTLVGRILLPELWTKLEHYVMLALFLGGLFIPMYIVGKKYE